MSVAMEIAKQVIHAEEVSRASKPEKEKEKENTYVVKNIDLSVAHDCKTILKPVYMEEINYVRFLSAASSYKYRINHGDWVTVPKETQLSVDEFNIEKIDIQNEAGGGTLGIYMEGIKCL